MKPFIASRTPLLDIQKCQRLGGGMYGLVLVASDRARAIAKAKEAEKPVVTALLEIQDGKIDGWEYLRQVREQNVAKRAGRSGPSSRFVNK
jgi:DNA-directed RNA polymerase subunit K/omega